MPAVGKKHTGFCSNFEAFRSKKHELNWDVSCQFGAETPLFAVLFVFFRASLLKSIDVSSIFQHLTCGMGPSVKKIPKLHALYFKDSWIHLLQQNTVV